jgi:hypothetical protein
VIIIMMMMMMLLRYMVVLMTMMELRQARVGLKPDCRLHTVHAVAVEMGPWIMPGRGKATWAMRADGDVSGC